MLYIFIIIQNLGIIMTKKMLEKFDIIILGAGSGGLAAAKRAAGYGKKVAIIEADRTGGTCVIRGCVPKKIMSFAAATADTLADAHGYGFSVSSEFNYAELVRKRNAEIAQLEDMHQNSLKSAGVEFYAGIGRLSANSPNHVIVETKETSITLEGTYIIIATGGKPVMPPVEGNAHAITSDGIFELDALPKTLAIVGGGYIGVEFASIFNALGSKIHLIVRRKTMLGGFDDDIRQALDSEMTKRGINFHCICNVARIEKLKNGQKKVWLDDNNTLEVDEILMATGRSPNTRNIGLEAAGITLDKAGAIAVNNTLCAQGAHTHIYAIGDVTNLLNLTPMAVNHGRMVVDNLFKGTKKTTGGMMTPTAVFSIPQIGTVGLTQADAENHYGKAHICVLKTSFRPMINTLPGRDERMLMKAIALKESGKIIGAHLIGRDSAEMVQLIGLAMQAGVTIDDLHNTLPLHPSSAEEFVLLN
mgnify:CR=1 FL=1